jgi:hypothetical protein
MKRAILMLLVVALLLGGLGQSKARANLITFDFNSLAPGADNTAIQNYMNSVLAAAGQSLRVTGVFNSQVATGPFGTGSQGNLSGNYVVNTSTSGDFFEVTFNQAIGGLSVDYVVAPVTGDTPDFTVTASGSVLTPYSASGSQGTNFTGSTGLLSFTANAISFHDDNQHQVAIDNLTISTIPEPATLTLLGIGAVGLIGYRWRRREQAVV